jgi:hypothetical protein
MQLPHFSCKKSDRLKNFLHPNWIEKYFSNNLILKEENGKKILIKKIIKITKKIKIKFNRKNSKRMQFDGKNNIKWNKYQLKEQILNFKD